ncbi:tyrosine-type recombinase/integrase [Halomonas smyrnensis]|uniref:tyrosine-type recombinase/integrase n=1 Tax=Halomonas smyrnensis TaxID=720605 RepID=UPI0002D6DD59|nr:site-specific integrase [Halomonas smyrnensis]
MPRVAKTLTPLEIKRLVEPGFYSVGGAAGLHLQVTKSGARSWILRTMVGTKRRDIGLGSAREVSVAKAREYALEIKRKIKEEGIDPVAERQAARSALLAAQAKAITFEECARKVIDKKKKEASNKKHGKQWETTLETYAFPILGKMGVDDIELAHIVEVLEPHWSEKTETMTRVRQRIEAVLSWASAHGYREGPNVAAWKNNLDAILPAPAKIAKVEHHRALDIDATRDFMADLRQRQGMAARCLEFVILTAVRSGEARGAVWSEIDFDKAVWTIPAERMKAGKKHQVPLSKPAVRLLESLPRGEDDALVFPAPRGGKLSDAAMGAVLKRMGHKVTVHGFRSTFRDWTAERTSTPHHVAEMALAHTIANGVEAAYRRGDLLEKRATLMKQWADFIDTKPAKGENITPIRQKKVAEPKS